MFEELWELDLDADESGLVEQISALERVKAAAAAGQARLSAAFDAARRGAEAATGLPAARRGRGVAAEVALARRDSPVRGGRHLGLAKALVYEMPHTLAALDRGLLSEWRATILVRESACLDVEDRRRLDAELCADPAGLEGKGDAALAAAAKAVAYRLDPHAVVDAVADPRSRATLRRLYAKPAAGALVATDSRARRFPKGLADFVGLRDQRCRTPYCDAPIRHRDHAKPHRRGGRTDAANGLGLCARCNYAKEAPGWEVAASFGEDGSHRAEFTTPTGAHHHSVAPRRCPGLRARRWVRWRCGSTTRC